MITRSLYLIFIFIGFWVQGLLAQHNEPALFIPEIRENWVKAAIPLLESIRPEVSLAQMKPEEISYEGYFRIKLRLQGDGFLRLRKNQWVGFRSTSSHENAETGDITLAIDHRGRIYRNLGHVCGGIISFETGDIRKLRNTRQFFRHFISETDEERWTRIQ